MTETNRKNYPTNAKFRESKNFRNPYVVPLLAYSQEQM